jgi:hypothetical protein
LSTDGENILHLVKQMRRLCEEMSLLLRAADENMLAEGWGTETKYALSQISYSIEKPNYWVPIMLYRYYKNENCPNRLAYICILLDDHWDRKYTLKEPLLTAGFFDYGSSQVGNNWDFWYFRYFGYLSKDHNLRPDGQVFQFERGTVPASIQGRFEELFENGEVFAVPLTSIKNSEQIKTEVTDKLLNRLKQ